MLLYKYIHGHQKQKSVRIAYSQLDNSRTGSQRPILTRNRDLNTLLLHVPDFQGNIDEELF